MLVAKPGIKNRTLLWGHKMSWKENRRRERVWYKYFRSIVDQFKRLLDSGAPVPAEAVLGILHAANSEMRVYRNGRIADSALLSLVQAAEDSGLSAMNLSAKEKSTSMKPELTDDALKRAVELAELGMEQRKMRRQLMVLTRKQELTSQNKPDRIPDPQLKTAGQTDDEDIF
jgi:hypothetical protein